MSGRTRWAVVVPVKRLREAKSRLRGAVAHHQELVLAMACDTVAAALACPRVARVLVVTDDPTVGSVLRGLGADVAADAPRAGLNAAVAHAQRLAAPGGEPVAALAADLPALRPAELAAALRAALADASDTPVRAFVPDLPGTGTTLLAAAGRRLAPRFGSGSAAAHAASGARTLDGDWPSLRRDVDTPSDLAAAVRLGVGAHTGSLADCMPAPPAGARAAHT